MLIYRMRQCVKPDWGLSEKSMWLCGTYVSDAVFQTTCPQFPFVHLVSSAAWFWVEVFCFRFKRLTNQSGVVLLISLYICNLMVRLKKKKYAV